VEPAIPDYELLRPIGRGAYGEVWLVRSVTGTYRAAKIVYRKTFEEARPFEREFVGIQRFEPVSRSQENQISILHIGRNETAGYFYYVMELADDAGTDESSPGSPVTVNPATYQPKTLKEVLSRRGRLPPQDCLKLAVSLSNALGHLHEHGLIHRDVKPSNIIFVNGQPKLADIGLVSRIDATHSFVGTEGYMPPEGPGSPAADLYSLGKVLYEAATGRNRAEFPLLPADFESLADRASVLELNEIVLKACADNRARRYASAAEMRGELLLLQAGKSVKRLHAMERQLKRLVPAFGIAAVLAGVIILLQRWETAQVRERAQIEAEYRVQAEKQEAVTRELLYAGDMYLVQQAYAESDFGRAEALLTAQIPQAGKPDLRGFEWRFFRQACQGQQQFTFAGLSNAVMGVAYSPDGHYLASGCYDQFVRVWDLASHKESASFFCDDEVDDVAFSPDGKRIMFYDRSGKLECHDLDTRRLRFQITNGVASMAASPVQDVVAVSLERSAATNGASSESNDVEVVFLDSRDGRELNSIPEDGSELSFSADGRRLAAGGGDRHINVWDLNERRVIASFNALDVRFNLCLSPDGNTLAEGYGDGSLRLMDLSGNRPPCEIQTRQGPVWQIAFSPDGRTVATTGTDQTIRLWNAHTLEGAGVFRGHRGEVWGIAFAPDGRTFATGSKDETVRLWNRDQPFLDAALTRTVSFWNWPIFSGDGGLLAAGDRKGVKVWRTGNGRETEFFTNAICPLGFSEDGQALWVLNPDATFELESLRDPAAVRTMVAGALDTGAVSAHAFLARRQWLALGMRDGTVRLWDLSAGKELHVWKGQLSRITSLTFSRDGERLISTSEEDLDVKVWRTATAELSLTLSGHKIGVFGAAFSPDGGEIATASPDDTCRLWDAATGRSVAVLQGHTGGAFSVAFAPDGKTLAVGTGAQHVRLWNLKTLRDIGMLETEPLVVFYAGFAPDGRTLATVSFDGPKDNCSLRLFRTDR